MTYQQNKEILSDIKKGNAQSDISQRIENMISINNHIRYVCRTRWYEYPLFVIQVIAPTAILFAIAHYALGLPIPFGLF